MRTDLAIQQWPATFPNVGGLLGKNTIVTDPNFGTQIVRVTDASSGAANNRSLQTSDSGQQAIWNSDDTMLICRDTGGHNYLFQFNPSTLQATQLSYAPASSVSFSSVHNNIMYSLVGTVINQITFTLMSGVWTFSSTTPIADFGNGGAGGTGYLPSGFVAGWNSAFTHSNDDTTFTVGFSTGGQDTGFYVCCYRVGSGYRIINTDTGAITGQWGSTGTGNLTNWQGITGGTANAFPFQIHEVFTAQNPEYAHVTPFKSIGANPLIWDVGTLNLTGMHQGGHCAQAYTDNYTAGFGGGQYQGFPFATPASPRFIMNVAASNQLPANQSPPQSYKGDMHHSLPFLGTADNNLLWTSNGPPSEFPFVSCWMGEVRGVDLTGAISGTQGTVYRACHTFNSGKSQEFITENAISIVSQTGRFVAFSSDWAGASTIAPLGSTSGAPTGTVGTNGRGDVFVVAIPTGTTVPTITSANNTTFTENSFGSFMVDTTGSPTPAITKSGSLPAGVTFVDNGNGTATLSGTPTASGTFPLTITATNSAGTVNQPFTLTVTAVIPPTLPAITSASSTTFTAGVLGAFTVDTTGNPTPSISESGALPTGVTFTDEGNGTGSLAGTPSSVGTYPLTYTASNSLGHAIQHFTLTVNSPIPSGSVTGTFHFANGNAVSNGRYQWELSADAVNVSIAAYVPTIVNGKLDSSGNMTQQLIFNDQLQTALGVATTYQLTVQDAHKRQVWNESYYLTGTAANINLITPIGGVE